MSLALDSTAGIAQAIHKLGRALNPSIVLATKEIYAPSVAAGQHAAEAVAVRRDLAYGTHERQVLDVYGADLQGPAIIFVHGGGFTGGDKRGDDLFHANIGYYFARNGVQAVLANYRLAPHSTWPSGIEDVASVVAWVRQHLGVGTSRRPLMLIGQSAGASHVAGYLFSAATAAGAEQHLAGCVLMSGLYRAGRSASPGSRAYFGEGIDADAVRSPIAQTRQTSVPLLLTVSEFDPGGIAWHTFAMAQAITQANDAAPAVHWFAGHNHVSTVHSLGSPQDDVGEVLRAFAARCAAQS